MDNNKNLKGLERLISLIDFIRNEDNSVSSEEIAMNILSNKDLSISLKLSGQLSNNKMTLDTTLGAIKKLCKDGIVTEEVTENLINEELNKSTNANGFDVQYDGDENTPKILIEVKSLSPGYGGFMTKQWKGILGDFNNLIDSNKKKRTKLNGSKSDYYKFFAICNHVKDNLGLTIEESIKKILKKKEFKEFSNIVLPYEENKNNLDKDHIYVMYVNL